MQGYIFLVRISMRNLLFYTTYVFIQYRISTWNKKRKTFILFFLTLKRNWKGLMTLVCQALCPSVRVLTLVNILHKLKFLYATELYHGAITIENELCSVYSYLTRTVKSIPLLTVNEKNCFKFILLMLGHSNIMKLRFFYEVH